MYCQIGNIVFDKLKTPGSISYTEAITYAEHSLINQANRLQPTGRELQEYELGLYLHASFCDVADELAALTTAARDYEVLPLLWGNGKVAGNFVIASMDITIRETDDLGNVYAAGLRVTLKEFIKNTVTKQQEKADKKAFATGNKKNVVGKKSGTNVKRGPTEDVSPNNQCNSVISNGQSKISSYAATIKRIHDEIQNGSWTGSPVPKLRVLYSYVNSVQTLASLMISRNGPCIAKYSLTAAYNDLVAKAGQLKSKTDLAIVFNTSSNAFVDLRSAHEAFQGAVSAISAGSSKAIFAHMGRKPDF